MTTMEVVDIYQGSGYYSVEVKTKIDGKLRYIDVRMSLKGLTFTVDKVGVAANKNRNYKFIDQMNNEYRYIKGVERLKAVRRDIINAVPKEVLQFALDTVYSEVKIDNSWFE